MFYQYAEITGLLLLVMFWSVRFRKLTIAGALTGGLLGFIIYRAAGYTGIAMTGMFFAAGNAATSWKRSAKEKAGLAELNKGRRTAGQVIANAGVAGIMGMLIVCFPEHAGACRLMMAASLAAAASDTLSSELGNLYGRRFYNVATFKPDVRGLNGVISLEGSLFGILGSGIIAIVYAFGFSWSIHVIFIIIAGMAGNLADSFLGATLERKHYLNNNAVNFANTLFAALCVLIMYKMLHT